MIEGEPRLLPQKTRQSQAITPEQSGVLHHWDVHIEILGKQIAEAKKGSWPERWKRLDQEALAKRRA